MQTMGIDTYGQTMNGLCRQFSVALDRDAIDQTGLTGMFDLHLELTGEDLFPSRNTKRSSRANSTRGPLGVHRRRHPEDGPETRARQGPLGNLSPSSTSSGPPRIERNFTSKIYPSGLFT
jgi:uncharacterized protein (TIGR03435 family)